MKHLLYLALVLCLGVFTTAQAQTWVPLNGPSITTAVRDVSITTSGNYLYVADANYVLKSASASTAWAVTAQPYSNPLLVLVKPDDPTKVVAARTEAVHQTTDGGANWSQKLNDPNLVPLRLVAAVTDPTVVLLGRTFVSDNGAIWRSSNGGASWSRITQFTNATDVHDFAVYPVEGDGFDGIALAGSINPNGAPEGDKGNSSPASTSGLWLSTNYGQSWNENGLGNRNVRSVAIVPKGENDYIRLIVDKVNGNDIVVRNPSLSDPEQWAEVFSDVEDVRMIRLKVSNHYVFLATNNGVYRSTDEGESWDPASTGLGVDLDVLSIAPTSDGSVVFAGTSISLYKSTDNGDNWIDVGKMNVSSVEVHGQSVWAVSRDNAFVGRSADAGSTWNNSYISSPSAPMSSAQIYCNPYNNNLFVAGTYSNGGVLYLSTDGGEGFANVYSMSPSGSELLGTTTDVLLDNDRVYAYGGGTVNSIYRNLFLSINGGISGWTDLQTDPDANTDGFVNDLVVIGEDTLYAAMSNGNIKKTVDEGATSWLTKTTVGAASNPAANTIALNASNLSVVYAGGNGGLKRSTDWGATWATKQTDNILRIALPYPTSSDVLYVITESGGMRHINYSTNGCTNWSSIESTLPQPISDIRTPVNAGFIFAATSSGVYCLDIPPAIPTDITGSVSSPGNHPRLDWNANTEEDLAATPYAVYKKKYSPPVYTIPADPPPGSDVIPTPNTYYVDESEVIDYGGERDPFNVVYWVKAVDQNSNYSGSTIAIGFTVEEGKGKISVGQQGKPTSFALYGNYPNPFNPTTEIRFDLPDAGNVSLVVYDVLGREVAQLASGYREAGYHSAKWNAAGQSSGVYFARFNVTNAEGKAAYSKINKLVLMK